VLTEEDVDGAKLQEPLEKHHKNALRWWLVCHGQLQTMQPKLLMHHETCCSLYRILEAKEDTTIVDVDGSYLQRKRARHIEEGNTVPPLPIPTDHHLDGLK